MNAATPEPTSIMSSSKFEEGPKVTEAWVCYEKGAPLKLAEIALPPLTATMIEVEMTHCGLCHTDLHMRDNDWGISDYPIVLGHEGVGTVVKVGSCVRGFETGDTVGIHWIRDSCQVCSNCCEGRENICTDGYQGTYLGPSAGIWGKTPHNTHGGAFSKVMRIEARFAIQIPPSLTPEVICPLLCGGGTVFEAIVEYVKPGSQVAVSSIGGLGTAAIKLAKMYGGQVTALSRGEAKKDKALSVGADGYYGCLGNDMMMDALAGTFDVLIDTCPVNKPIDHLIGLLKIGGTYVRVGLPNASDNTFTYNFGELVCGQKKIAGSIVTGTKRLNHLVNLASGLTADSDEWKTEVLPFSDVNETMELLKDGKTGSTWRYIFQW